MRVADRRRRGGEGDLVLTQVAQVLHGPVVVHRHPGRLETRGRPGGGRAGLVLLLLLAPDVKRIPLE